MPGSGDEAFLEDTNSSLCILVQTDVMAPCSVAVFVFFFWFSFGACPGSSSVDWTAYKLTEIQLPLLLECWY